MRRPLEVPLAVLRARERHAQKEFPLFEGTAPRSDQPRRRRPRRHRSGPRPETFAPTAPEAVAPLPASPAATSSDTHETTFAPEPACGYLVRDERSNSWTLRRRATAREGVYVPPATVPRAGLREGDLVEGTARAPQGNQRYPGLVEVATVNGVPVAQLGRRPRFEDLTPLHPDRMLRCEVSPDRPIGRMVDLFAPIGAGQRALIVSPPKAGKTTILKDIATAISQNCANSYIILCLVGERPEEVTDIQRTVRGELHASSFDDDPQIQIAVAELAGLRAERLAEMGKDVVIILDSLTRLARAYNLSVRGSGRTLSGGMDPAAVAPSKKFFGRARNLEEGGSITIVASVLVSTGSRLDDLIYEEFKGTGNMEIVLDRGLAERRTFPAIDIPLTGTRMEERLLSSDEYEAARVIRRSLAAANGSSTEFVLKQLEKVKTNSDIVQMALKARA